MRHLATAILCFVCLDAGASTAAVKARELVHPFPPTGPVEVAGTAPGNRVLRAMQRYAVPALTDVLADHIANTLRGASDLPVTVTRKHRQGGREAAAFVSRAEADGRTLLLANDVPVEAHSGSEAALRPVASIAGMPYVLVAAHDAKHADLAELIRDARSAERTFVATAGGRSAAHHALVRLRQRHGLRIEPVAYNGGNAALQAVVTKQPPTAFVPLPAVLPYASGGRLKILAIADARRHPSIPHVQTGGEGGLSDFEAVGWFGLFAPSGTSPSVLRDLDAMLARGPQSEATRFTFETLGLRLEHRTADAFAELLLRSAHGGRKTGGRGAT